MRRPIFLDRDGVLNVDISPYVCSTRDLSLFPWTISSLRKLHEAGFELFVVSNQQGVAKGLYTLEELDRINSILSDAAAAAGAPIRKIYCCTAPKRENHPWRKPAPGMIFAARDEFGLNLDGAFLVGDKWSDIECAVRAGVRPLLVHSGVTAPGEAEGWQHRPEAEFTDLRGAVEYVLNSEIKKS